MGSRIGAWIVDALLVLLMLLFLGPTPLSPFAKYHEDLPAGIDGYDACEILEDSGEANACIGIGDRVYYTEDNVAWLPVAALALYGLLVLGLLQGTTGWTPGKLLFGVRVVGENGQRPGVGRALLRSLLWVVDAQPCGIPLVGFVTALTSTGHRRVGDMAAKTHVVRASDVGEPISVPGIPAAGYGAAPGYAAYPGYGTPTTYPSPPGAYGAGVPGAGQWGAAPPPPAGPWSTAPGASPGAPGGPPTAPPRPAPPVTGETPVSPAATPQPLGPVPTESSSPSSDTEPAAVPRPEAEAPAPEPEPQPEPAREPTASAPEPGIVAEAVAAPEDAPAQPSASAPASETTKAPPTSGGTPVVETEVVSVPETAPTASTPEPAIDVGPSSPPPEGTRPEYSPQWDAARGTYIQWDANRSRWLQWDDAAKEWKAI